MCHSGAALIVTNFTQAHLIASSSVYMNESSFTYLGRRSFLKKLTFAMLATSAGNMLHAAPTTFTVGPFVKIYDPSIGNTKWYINDHCIVQSFEGIWHLFGITHPEPANAMDEKFLAHATAPTISGPWTRQPHVMHADPSKGETLVWAPYVIKAGDVYFMFYCAGGTSHEQYRIHAAYSQDLYTWIRHSNNPMVVDGFDARDPMVLRVGDEWVMYYTATSQPSGGNHVVASVRSSDLNSWKNKQVVFVHPTVGTFGGPTESPFVVQRGGKYYLFVCTNTPYDDTAVYESDSPFHWDIKNKIGNFPAHAAEVIQAGGLWLVTRAGWGRGGVYLAQLKWKS